MRTALSWVIMQQMVLIPYQHFRTAYRSIFKGQESNSWPLMGLISYPKTSVRNYHYLLWKYPKEHSSHLLRGGSLRSRIVRCCCQSRVLGNCIKCNIKWHPNYLFPFWFQLFYLITDLYKEGNAKEMKKWAYEIHSSFLVPGAVSSYFWVILLHVWLRLPQRTDVIVYVGVLLGK